jgi:hypothetical protein
MYLKTEASVDRPIRDNFVASPISKQMQSPVSPGRENPLYSSVQNKVATSLQFNSGAFKESSIIDRLTSYARNLFVILIDLF